MQDNNSQKDTNQESLNNAMERFQSMSFIKKIGSIGIIILMFSVMVFILFFSGKNSDNKDTKDSISKFKNTIQQQKIDENKDVYSKQAESENNIMKNIESNIINLKPPAPPALEKIEIPTPKPHLMPAMPIETAKKPLEPQLPIPGIRKSETKTPQEENKISSTSIMTFGGGGSKDGNQDNSKNTASFLGFDGGTIENSSVQPTAVEPVIVTKINNDLKYTLVQGKIIDAVLETAINTQMNAGVIRAVVSRDVYAEQGDLVLIPKGSRLVGSYGSSASSSGGGSVMTRVYATWNRVITPSGIDINLPATQSSDPLGRNGIPGYLDTNLTNNLINAFLVSVLGPYLVTQASGSGKDPTPSPNNNNSGSNNSGTSGTVRGQVLTQGMQQFQSVASDQLNKIYPPGPTTVYVDQGSRIDIIIQKDIVFPKQSIAINTTNLP